MNSFTSLTTTILLSMAIRKYMYARKLFIYSCLVIHIYMYIPASDQSVGLSKATTHGPAPPHQPGYFDKQNNTDGVHSAHMSSLHRTCVTVAIISIGLHVGSQQWDTTE